MRYPVNRNCPLTGEPHERIVFHIPAEIVAKENPTYRSSFSEILGISPNDEFPIVQSRSGFLFAGWLPPDDFLNSVYDKVIDHSKTSTQSIWYRRSLLEFCGAFLRVVEKHGPLKTGPLRLLDFGCGYGSILRMLSGREIECFGYEPSDERNERARGSDYKLLKHPDEIEAAGPFHLIVCTEVLEHVDRPREVLRLLKKNAAPGALYALTVPNIEKPFLDRSVAQLLADKRLPGVFNPWEHLNYFSSGTFRRLLAEENITVLEDFGRSAAARDASARFGAASGLERALNCLRVAKRVLAAPPSTELFCQGN